jgi:hypothetical protein
MSYVKFCPDGKQFTFGSGAYEDYEYKLYEFDGLKLKKPFRP